MLLCTLRISYIKEIVSVTAVTTNLLTLSKKGKARKSAKILKYILITVQLLVVLNIEKKVAGVVKQVCYSSVYYKVYAMYKEITTDRNSNKSVAISICNYKNVGG